MHPGQHSSPTMPERPCSQPRKLLKLVMQHVGNTSVPYRTVDAYTADLRDITFQYYYTFQSKRRRCCNAQASSSGQITFQEPGADGQPGKEASLDFFAADTQRLRRQLPKGTLVEFNICTDNQTKQRRAVQVSLDPAAASCNALCCDWLGDCCQGAESLLKLVS